MASEFKLTIGMQSRASSEILGCAGVVRESVRSMADDIQESIPGVTCSGMNVFGEALEAWLKSFRALNQDLTAYGQWLSTVDAIAVKTEETVSEAFVRQIATLMGGS